MVDRSRERVAARVLMFFHGGGYCSGSILSHRRMVTEAGRAGGVRTLAVGYRLAPEHPFPAALEDATTAWRFLRKQGIAANNIAIGGDSAGGGLTIALSSPARRRRGASRLRLAGVAVDGPHDVRLDVRRKDSIDPLIHKGYLEELADAYVPAGWPRDPGSLRSTPI